MHRRSFVSLTALSGVVLVLPNALVACGSQADLAPGAAGSNGPPNPGALGSGEAGKPGTGNVAQSSVAAPVVAGKGWKSRRVTAGGNLFDLYPLQNRVDFLTPSGDVQTSITTGLNAPIALGVAATGNVLVLELGASRVSAYSSGGASRGAFASGLALSYPSDLVTFGDTVAIADTLNHRVALIAASGRSTGVLGSFGTGSGGLNGPSSVAFSPDGSSIFVADQGNSRVQVFSPSGRVTKTLGSYGTSAGRFLEPCAVRVDGNGSLYVADTVSGYVSIFDSGLAFKSRFRPVLPNGATGVPVWLSTQADGSILVGAVAGAPA